MLARSPMTTTPKARVCSQCPKEFLPRSSTQRVCSQRCAMKVVKAHKAKEKAELKARKKAIKRLSEYRAEAQQAFNDWVRARDADLPCVSCGATNPPMKPGGQWDAGHFLSRGAYPELAFHEDNCHKQCKSCNAGSGKFSHKARTVSQNYEMELLRRIGAERMAALKGPHEATKYKKGDYERIRATYKAKLKALKDGT